MHKETPQPSPIYSFMLMSAIVKFEYAFKVGILKIIFVINCA